MAEEGEGSYLREKSKNLYEPCDSLPKHFQASCYFEQVQWWQNVFNSDFKYIGELCGTLPRGSVEFIACYNGIGNYVAAETESLPLRIISLCSVMPDEETESLCIEGASWLVGFNENNNDTKLLCEALEGLYKTACLQKMHL
jgi:hypothetical protein